jgi:enoyl-CoA hydratase/carnithine racemase
MSAPSGDVISVLDLSSESAAIDPDVLDRCERTLDELERADSPRALVTTASGKVWSNGLDLLWMVDNEDQIVDYLTRVQTTLARVLELGVPTVAAVNSHAFGAGAMLALCHDAIVMRRDRGYWCLPEVDLGMELTPGEFGLIRAKLPPVVANEALTTGRRYSGPEALAAGIVHCTAEVDDVLDDATAIATERSTRAGSTLRSIKRGMYGTIADQLRRDMADLAASEDADRMRTELMAALRRP